MPQRKLSGKKTVTLRGKNLNVVIAPGAEIIVLHEISSRGKTSVSVTCGVRSRVAWNTRIHATDVTLRQSGAVGAGAEIVWRTLSEGDGIDAELLSHVTGRNAKSSIEWTFIGHGSERQNISAKNIFSAPGGRGEIIMRGIAEGKSQIIARGLIGIGKKGARTSTHLTQDILMLDPTAKVDAVPALEIKTNDVKASHSATISRVTPEHLFYFQSRGIPEKKARAMYTEGFLGELISRITN